MTKAQARRRRKIRRKVQYITAWSVVVAFELITSAAAAAVTAAIVIPLAQWERGYTAYGSEWLLIAIVFCATYYKTHNRICDRIFEEGQEMPYYNTCPDCGNNLDPGEICDCRYEREEKRDTAAAAKGGVNGYVGHRFEAGGGKLSWGRDNQLRVG